MCVFFFFKHKTANEMRISDWSADVCSSDLAGPGEVQRDVVGIGPQVPVAADELGALVDPDRLRIANHGAGHLEGLDAVFATLAEALPGRGGRNPSVRGHCSLLTTSTRRILCPPPLLSDDTARVLRQLPLT